MAPIGTILAFAFLAIGSVDAKDKISFSQYDNEDCDGHPLNGFIDLTSKVSGGCKAVNARGIRFHKSLKDKYNSWIPKVNDGKLICEAELYNSYDCYGDPFTVSFPKQLQECIPLKEGPYSVRYFCDTPSMPAVRKEVRLPMTSYSIAPDGKAHPSVYTTSFNITVPTIPAKAKVRVIDDSAARLHPREESVHKPTLEPRADYNVINVWMKHPWTGSDICYRCFTDHPESWRDWRCESAPAGKNHVSCDEKPTPIPATSTHVVTHTTEATIYYTSIDQLQEPPMDIMERSDYLPVILHHPWGTFGHVCGQAKWKDMADHDEEIHIKDDSCKPNPVNIDIGYPHTVVNSPVTETRWVYGTLTPSASRRPRPHYTHQPEPVDDDYDDYVVTYTTVLETTYLTEVTSTVTAPVSKRTSH